MLVVTKEEADKVIEALEQIGEAASVIGEIVKGNKGVLLCQD